MKILVTGATGFIGSYVIKRLLSLNHEVLATAIESEEVARNRLDARVTYCSYQLGEPIQEEQRTFFKQADRCIHLAWGGLSNFKAEEHEKEYPDVHFQFLTTLLDLGVKRMTITGTCLEYGLQEGELDETMTCSPVTAYGKGKLILLNQLSAITTHEISFDWVRLFYMYGEGQNPKSILAQLDRAIVENHPVFNMSKGEQWRDYLPIEKIAAILVDLALKENGCGIVNCANGKPISILELVENHLAKRAVQLELNQGYYPYPDYEPFRFWGSVKKLTRQFTEK